MYTNGYRRLNGEKVASANIKVKHHNKKIDGLTYGVFLNAAYNLKTDFLLWEDATYGALKQNDSTALEYRGSMITIDPFISLIKENRHRHDLRVRFQQSSNILPDASQNNSDPLSLLAEYQSWYRLFEKLDLIAGLSQRFSKVISNFYGDHDRTNTAVYVQLDYSPVEKLKLNAGLRTELNTLDGEHDRIIPIFRAGLNFQAANATFIRASFGEGYRYPSIAEMFATTTVGAIKIYPNDEIRPESGWSTELGIKQGISSKESSGYIDLSLFYSQNTNLIEYVFGYYPDPVTDIYDFGFRAINIENSRVYGFEFEYMANRSIGAFNTTFSGGYTYMYPVEFNKSTKKNTDDFLKYRRHHSLKISASTIYRNVEFGMSILSRSKILDIDDVFLNPFTRETILPGFFDYWTDNNDAYIALDIHLAYQIGSVYNLSLSVKNLNNAEYMGRPGDIQPQRSFGLQFSGKF